MGRKRSKTRNVFGWVYVAGMKDHPGVFKIGYSATESGVDKRLDTFKVSNPFGCYIARRWTMKNARRRKQSREEKLKQRAQRRRRRRNKPQPQALTGLVVSSGKKKGNHGR